MRTRFSRDYRFKQKYFDRATETESYSEGVVIDIGQKKDERIVMYDGDGKNVELLHIDDIEYLPTLPRFKESLHVGHEIEYTSYSDKQATRATVVETGPSEDLPRWLTRL